MKFNKKSLLKKLAIGIATVSLGISTLNSITMKPVQAASYDTNEMRSFVRSTIAQYSARGTVVIIKDGQPQQISYGYGWYGKRLGAGNVQMIYPICSLQKTITAAIVTQLIYQGKFNQDTPISRWYPKMKNASRITVGNLMTHTSGIKATGTEINRGRVYSEQDAINWVVNRVNQINEDNPGNFNYNNTNYILLAGIIRQVTGQSYKANVQNRIIKPLGLKRTYFYEDVPKNKHKGVSYTWNRKNYQVPQTVKKSLASQLPGAGNLFSAPMDYYRIQVGLTNGKILNPDQFNFMTHLKAKAANSTYSGGMYIRNNGSLKSAYGNLAGTHFGNWFQMSTDNRNGMIMFLNQTQNDENRNKVIGYQILQHVQAGMFLSR